VVAVARIGVLVLSAVLAAVCAAPAWAGTWTIQGTVQNTTSSTGPCPGNSPANDVGCVDIPTYVFVDASLKYDGQQGSTFPPYVPAGQSGNFLWWAEGFDEGADAYAPAQAPDGSNYVLSLQDDVGAQNYAGCAEATTQSPQVVCLPSWEGQPSSVNAAFTFSDSSAAPTIAAGQHCGALLGGGGPMTVNCTTGSTDGNISPVSSTGPLTTVVFQTLNPSVGITVTPDGWPNCQLGAGAPDTCTLTVVPNWPPAVTVTLTSTTAQAHVGVEVTAVSNGPYTIAPPTVLPTGSLVARSLRPGRTLKPGQAALVGPYRVVMRADGHLSEYIARGTGRFLAFDSGTSRPGSRLVAQRDGSVIVQSPASRTLWSSNHPGASTQGSLVLYSGAPRRLWATGAVTGPVALDRRSGLVHLASGRGIPAGGHVAVGPYRLAMQTDGNLVLSRHGHRRWSSATRGHPGAYLVVQPDGNVVVDSIRHVHLWSSRTGGHRAAGLELRDTDGRLAVRARAGQPLRIISNGARKDHSR
jgi:hypothetical protein